MRRTLWTAPISVAILVALAVVALAGLVDSFARRADVADQRAFVSAHADATTRDLSDVIARETAAVETLAAFVQISADDPERLAGDFATFADALMRQGGSIRSVQLAPGSVLEYVFPLEGNEAAVGLDLLADADRRRLLVPAITSGATVVQGPVELVQGGLGILVRKPAYDQDGTFWGFAAVLLDWPSIAQRSGFASTELGTISAIRMAGQSQVLAGDPQAFTDDPLVRRLVVGATDTTWEFAMRPADGWPTTASLTKLIWALGGIGAAIAGVFAYMVALRPEILRRERERAVSALAVADARYQSTFQHADIGIAIVDATGKVLSANPAFASIVGSDDAPVDGLRVLNFVDPEDHRLISRALLDLQRGERVVEAEARIAGSRGQRWMRTRITPITGRADELPHYVAISEDTTVRRLAEQALTASETRFRQLFELAPIAIQREDHRVVQRRLGELVADGHTDLRAKLEDEPSLLWSLLADTDITDANPAAESLQKHLERQKADRTLMDRFSPEAGSTFIESMVAMHEGRTAHELAVETRGPDGAPQHFDVRWYVPTHDGSPDFANVMVTITDVTALRDTERRLTGLLASKDRFLASVAHELRTPLTAVVGFAQELVDGQDRYSVADQSEFKELIAFHSMEMSMIIDDLLVWARADIGEVRIEPEMIDLHECVRQTLSVNPDCTIRVVEPSAETKAYADPTRTRQIIRNLATNAVRYGGADPAIEVGTDGTTTHVEVADSGAEIPPVDIARIFEPYERVVVDKAQPGSIGLGLPVSRSLARLQGGDVTVIRRGNRNVFRLALPANPPIDR